MARDKPPGLQAVAERAGVSAMTASLALRGDSRRMSRETRLRVLEAARELRYQPNARARALRLGRTNVIGLYAGHGFVNVRSPFFTEIVSGLQEGCETARKDLLLHGAFRGGSSEDILLELLDGRIDGLIVTMRPTDPIAKSLAASGFPVVAIADPISGVPAILVDDADGARQTAAHLALRGHGRVLFVMGPTQPVSALRRRDAFLNATLEAGVATGVWTLREGAQADLLKHARAAGITALACWSDDAAYDLLAEARELGLKIPADVAICGFDGCPSPYAVADPLTTVVAPWAEAACRAVLSLGALLDGEEVPQEQVLPVRLSIGSTT
jgi:LacI family transcriptional regulator